MKNLLLFSALTTSCIISLLTPANAAPKSKTINKLVVTSQNISHEQPIDEKYAYCAPDGRDKTRLSNNVNPHLAWKNAPAGTKSFAIVMVDPDVPASFENANLANKTIPADAPRQNFYHWVVTDLPMDSTEIPENDGKKSEHGISHINDYASFMTDVPAQNFVGYDGPCPPFNDLRVHNYHFVVYALNVESLGKGEMDNGRDVIKDIEKHALAKGEIISSFTNNISLLK